ncbi:MAG: hypothetical protein M3P39_10980 [Actinomycetota bacterium]|nr:hypothetical protein [Actinomycetota bacterium]
MSAATQGGAAAVAELAAALVAERVVFEELGLRRPTLDDAFLTLTGRPAATGDDVVDDSAPVLQEVR